MTLCDVRYHRRAVRELAALSMEGNMRKKTRISPFRTYNSHPNWLGTFIVSSEYICKQTDYLVK